MFVIDDDAQGYLWAGRVYPDMARYARAAMRDWVCATDLFSLRDALLVRDDEFILAEIANSPEGQAWFSLYDESGEVYGTVPVAEQKAALAYLRELAAEE